MASSLREKETVTFDTETTGLDPYTSELRLMQFSPDPDRAFLIDLRDFAGGAASDELGPVRDLLSDARIEKTGHNLKFDAKFVKHHLGCDIEGIFDTFLMSRVEACGDKTRRHGLGVAAEHYLGIAVDKTEQRSDWSANELSERQVEYAAKDVCVLHDLQASILKKLTAKSLNNVAKLENDVVMAMAQLELNGFYLDASMWRQQLRSVENAQVKLTDALQDILSGGMRQTGLFGRLELDLGSHTQVGQALLGLGVPVPTTDAGNYTTKETEIENLKYDFPAVDKLLEWRGLEKQRTSYGENILDLIHPVTGRLHSDFAQLRAPSGRMGSENPNLQNVPQPQEYRSCFKAPEGKKLVICDFSQIELRLMAEISEDAAMLQAFKDGKDYHTSTAASVFNVPFDQVTPEQRSFAKRVNFGIGYGIGPGKLSRMTGMDFETTKQFLKQYFAALKGLDSWLKRQAYMAVKLGYVRTLSGRRADLMFDRNDDAQRSSAERIGKNIPIQGSAADIFKRALCLIHDALKGTSGKLVNLVHDEFVAECDAGEAERVAGILEKGMRQAGADYTKKVEITADAKIASEWSK